MRDYAVVSEALAADLGPIIPFTASDASIEDVFRLSLRNSFFKKLLPSGLSGEMIDNALKKFIAFNRSLPEDFEWAAHSEEEALFFDYFRNHLNCALATGSVDAFQLSDLSQWMTPGPGAAQKADSRTKVTKLFESRMSYANEKLVSWYRSAISETDWWCEAEKARFTQFGFSMVRGCKLFFVPKSTTPPVARTCCTEALLESIIQQGIRGYLESRLSAYFGINLDTQPGLNRALARRGSRDGSYGTMDLSSASDSNGLSLFENVVENSPIRTAILNARSEVAILPDGNTEKLRMVATMGNAFCFPLMTIILASAVRSVYDLMAIDTEFGVFGDDIVVDQRAFSFLGRMLVKLGYLVNDDKSFNQGGFRESCGHDYYLGTNVRGVYIKTLESEADVFSALNRLGRWSAYTGIRLPRTLLLLRSWARDMRVPPSEADWSGIHTPFRHTLPSLDAKYWYRYRCFKRLKRTFRPKEPDDAACINPLGSACGYIIGVHAHIWSGIRKPEEGNIHSPLESSIRDFPGSAPRVKIVRKSLPYWDYVPPDSEPGEAWLPGQLPKKLTEYDKDVWRSSQREDYRRWEAAVEVLFTT